MAGTEEILSKYLVMVNDSRPNTEGLEACPALLFFLSSGAVTHGVATTKLDIAGNATCLINATCHLPTPGWKGVGSRQYGAMVCAPSSYEVS